MLSLNNEQKLKWAYTSLPVFLNLKQYSEYQ